MPVKAFVLFIIVIENKDRNLADYLVQYLIAWFCIFFKYKKSFFYTNGFR